MNGGIRRTSHVPRTASVDGNKIITAVVEFHAEWVRRDAVALKGGLVLALVRERPELFHALRQNLLLVNELPETIRNDWRGKFKPNIGPRTLERLMPQIVAAYKAREDQSQGFVDFVNMLTERAGTAKKLRELLQDFAGEYG